MTCKNEWAQTPPMGWNSWDCYGASVNEEAVRGNADYMAKNLKKYGWKYIVVDIQWSQSDPDGWNYRPFTTLCMDEYSRLIPAENRFPSSKGGKGFGPLAEYVHSLGLLFGIHIMRGIPRQAVHGGGRILGSGMTVRECALPYSVCPWNTDMYGLDHEKEGSQKYYDSLFKLYASWGVDFVKVDDIANTEFLKDRPYSAEKEIEMIRLAIDRCNRPIVLSLSPGPAPLDHAWHLCENANMWRMTGDFWDAWPQLYATFEKCEKWSPYVGNGCWPDCDMLPLGTLMAWDQRAAHKTRFTQTEQITLMNLWCIFRSPLMMGGEMRENDSFTLSLLTNEASLYLNQHGKKPRQLFRTDTAAGWMNTDDRECVYIALFNLGDDNRTVKADNLPQNEVWTEVRTGKTFITEELEKGIILPPHGSCLLMLKNAGNFV